MTVHSDWTPVSLAFSIRQKSARRYQIRREATGEIVSPKGPAANDALMMARHKREVPVAYVHYAFGNALHTDEV
jgi:hypothetical protein